MLVSILRTTLRHSYTSLFTKARRQRHCSTAQTLCPGLFGLSWHQLKQKMKCTYCQVFKCHCTYDSWHGFSPLMVNNYGHFFYNISKGNAHRMTLCTKCYTYIYTVQEQRGRENTSSVSRSLKEDLFCKSIILKTSNKIHLTGIVLLPALHGGFPSFQRATVRWQEDPAPLESNTNRFNMTTTRVP